MQELFIHMANLYAKSVIFVFPFVCLYVCMFVCPSIALVDIWVKVLKMLYYEGLMMDFVYFLPIATLVPKFYL